MSSILFVFDGFDEIADFKIRETVIEFINKGINRLQENSKSIQVLITSRPAAFSDTVGFSVDLYPHFELADISEDITKEYVEKWIKASRLDSREAAEIKRLVDEKLKMPHLKDLAKSPMQLAIFISLLRTRGESLPNKRTALYDSYIDLFFNRESEKNSVIRDNRDLIIDIHQYLAWILHSEAEMLKNTGSIPIEDLKVRLKEYLEKEGHKSDITDQLFHVLEERVCALVSRVQGTYEFEVQPLREYFCAKYLYNTSPYSPAGSEKTGTKPERFSAIATNFYWHNVVRFFAGCFDKGELPMLIQQLRELQEDKFLKYTNYPRLIISQILSDWVFTQYPLLLKDVIRMIVDGVNIGDIINQNENQVNNEPIVLPIQCGRIELVKECFEELKRIPHDDYAFELISIINNNPYKKEEFWLTNITTTINENDLTKWLEYAYRLQIIYKLEKSILLNVLNVTDENVKFKRLQILINGNRTDILDMDLNIKEVALKGILNNDISFMTRGFYESPLHLLTLLLYPHILERIQISNSTGISVFKILNTSFRHYTNKENEITTIDDFLSKDEIDEKVKMFLKSIEEILNLDVKEWSTSIEPWDILVRDGIQHFNYSWKFKILAVISAGIKVKDETFEEFNDFNNNEISLCKRIKFARQKSGSFKYWEGLFEITDDICFVLLIFFTWATARTIIQLIDKVAILIMNLSFEEYIRLSEALKETVTNSTFTQPQSKELIKAMESQDYENDLKYLICLRLSEKLQNIFMISHFNSNDPKLQSAVNETIVHLIAKYLQNPSDRNLLGKIKDLYSHNLNYSDHYSFYGIQHISQSAKIPIEVAQQIMKDPKNYPRIIAATAEKSCRLNANKHLIAVGKIAQEKNWSFQ